MYSSTVPGTRYTGTYKAVASHQILNTTFNKMVQTTMGSLLVQEYQCKVSWSQYKHYILLYIQHYRSQAHSLFPLYLKLPGV